MATKQEELENLCKMRDAIKEINRLEERLEKEKEAISKETARKINDYPKFVPSGYNYDPQQSSRKGILGKLDILGILDMLDDIVFEPEERATWIAGLIPLVYVILTHLLSGSYQIITGIIEFIFCLLPPLIVGFIPIPISKFIPIPIFKRMSIFINGGAIAAIMQYCASRIWCDEDQLSTITPEQFVNNALIYLLSIFVYILAFFIVRSRDEAREKKRLQEAEEKERLERAEYERKKAIAMVEIRKQREALALEVKQNIAIINTRIKRIENAIINEKAILDSTLGLAKEDKNLYTVETLIKYFERGKADSIKEAINLFDMEERERARDSAARVAQLTAYYTQQAALEKMAREQEEHNATVRRMAREQEEHNAAVRKMAREQEKKIDDFIDDIKRGN